MDPLSAALFVFFREVIGKGFAVTCLKFSVNIRVGDGVMIKTRDKIFISLTAVIQAVYGAVFIYRMLAWKTLVRGDESELLKLEISLAALFAVTVIFSVVMRDLPAKIYSLPALCCPLLFQLAAMCGIAGSAYDSDWNERLTAAGVIAIIAFAVIAVCTIVIELRPVFKASDK